MQSSLIEESAMDLSKLYVTPNVGKYHRPHSSQHQSSPQTSTPITQKSSVICATLNNSSICDTPSGMDLSVASRRNNNSTTNETTSTKSSSIASSTSAVATVISTTANSVPQQSRIEKVLQRYQETATMTLNGPDWSAYSRSLYSTIERATPDTLDLRVRNLLPVVRAPIVPVPDVTLKDYDPLLAPPPFPIQQPPLLTPPDQSPCSRSETMLDGEMIACFNVGGEKRLCFPQILNIVLRDFTLQQINAIVKELQIYCSTCTAEQMEVLKRSSDIPTTAPSCGLITKTDAHRLCSTLLALNPPQLDFTGVPTIKIYHECFGRCVGRYAQSLYKTADSLCVQCEECFGAFSLPDFVSHSHRHRENRTVHWGFDPNNWRSYVLPVEDYTFDTSSNLVNCDTQPVLLPVCDGGRKALKNRLTAELKATYKSVEHVKLMIKEMKSRFLTNSTNQPSTATAVFPTHNENNKRKIIDNFIFTKDQQSTQSSLPASESLSSISKRIKTEPSTAMVDQTTPSSAVPGAMDSSGLISALAALNATAAYPFLQSYLTNGQTVSSSAPQNVQQYALNLFAGANQLLNNLINTNSLTPNQVSTILKTNPLLSMAVLANCDSKVKKETDPTVSGTTLYPFRATGNGSMEHTQLFQKLSEQQQQQQSKCEYPMKYENLTKALLSNDKAVTEYYLERLKVKGSHEPANATGTHSDASCIQSTVLPKVTEHSSGSINQQKVLNNSKIVNKNEADNRFKERRSPNNCSASNTSTHATVNVSTKVKATETGSENFLVKNLFKSTTPVSSSSSSYSLDGQLQTFKKCLSDNKFEALQNSLFTIDTIVDDFFAVNDEMLKVDRRNSFKTKLFKTVFDMVDIFAKSQSVNSNGSSNVCFPKQEIEDDGLMVPRSSAQLKPEVNTSLKNEEIDEGTQMNTTNIATSNVDCGTEHTVSKPYQQSSLINTKLMQTNSTTSTNSNTSNNSSKNNSSHNHHQTVISLNPKVTSVSSSTSSSPVPYESSTKLGTGGNCDVIQKKTFSPSLASSCSSSPSSSSASSLSCSPIPTTIETKSRTTNNSNQFSVDFNTLNSAISTLTSNGCLRVSKKIMNSSCESTTTNANKSPILLTTGSPN